MTTTAKSLILAVWQVYENKWIDTAELRAVLPENKVTTASLYNTLSVLATKEGILRRRKKIAGNGFEYQVINFTPTPKAEDAPPSSEADLFPPPPPAEDTAPPEPPAPEPEVQYVDPGVSGSARRIEWDEGERVELAEFVFKLRKDKPYLPLLAAFEQAQYTLPEDRRRIGRILGISHVPWLVPLLQEIETAHKNAAPPPPPPPPDPNELIAGLPTGLLLNAITERLGDILHKAIVKALTSPELRNMVALNIEQPTLAPRHNPEPAAMNMGRRPKVLICGCHTDWVGKLNAEFGKEIDLRFYRQEQSANTLKAVANASIDKIIVMTEHVPHHVPEVLKSMNVPYMRLSGRLPALTDALTKYYCGE